MSWLWLRASGKEGSVSIIKKIWRPVKTVVLGETFLPPLAVGIDGESADFQSHSSGQKQGWIKDFWSGVIAKHPLENA
jgi:hypothetical protein